MKLKHSTNAAILVSALAGSPVAMAESKVDFFGSIAGGFLYKVDGKMKTDTEKKQAATNATGANTAADKAYGHFSSGYATATFGADMMINESVTAQIELKTAINDSKDDGEVALRKYFFDMDTGAGHVLVGRQDRLFGSVAYSADNFSMADLGYAGAVGGDSRSTGFTYKTGDLIEPVELSLGFYNNSGHKMGYRKDGEGKANEPSIEFSVAGDAGPVNIALGLISEKRLDSEMKSVGAMAYSLGVTGGVSMLDFALVYTGGDALNTSATSGAVLSSKAKDSMMAVSFHGGASFGDLKTGLYYGMENLGRKKKNGAVNTKGEEAAVTYAASTVGVHFGYEVSDVEWFAEYAMTTATYDSVDVANTSSAVFGAQTKFKS